MSSVADILREDERRKAERQTGFDPVSGKGSPGERVCVTLEGLGGEQWLPPEMLREPLLKAVERIGFDELCEEVCPSDPDVGADVLIEEYAKLRCKYDFPFWCATMATIKQKGGAEGRLVLNYAQRRFVERVEALRAQGKPIRLMMLKARQWGGSTVSQLYMAWLQLLQAEGLNSLIIAHQGTGSDEIKDMFDRLMENYPDDMLVPGKKMEGVGRSGNIYRVAARKCKIKIGTAERPNSCRGGDYSLVHLSEVGLWPDTPGKRPEDIVGAACTGVLYEPLTMIVFESTAKGSDTFFHREYLSAKRGESQFEAMFVPWYWIEKYALPFGDEAEREAFAKRLESEKDSEARDGRRPSGRYLWRLWQSGATLEGINWYIKERSGKPSDEIMQAECPTDDVEAFTIGADAVFDPYKVEAVGKNCREAVERGETDTEGVFKADSTGRLLVWERPQDDAVSDRYVVAVDVGRGRTDNADNSVIVVIDREPMIGGMRPKVVAEWTGHIDMDLLAWKAVGVARWYKNALLVIESNTLESAGVEGSHGQFILDEIRQDYRNLYARRQSPDDMRAGKPKRYGFHTNVATKAVIIDHLIKQVRECGWVERSRACVEELKSYVRTERGVYEAAPGAHDDRLMTRAIGLYVSAREMRPPRDMEEGGEGQYIKPIVSEATM